MAELAPALALASALPLPLASLPVFGFGYWDKAEPLVVWFHASAALATLAVVCALWRLPQPTLERILHPFVVLPLGVGVWSAMIAPAVQLPWLSLLGAPQSGFGALWFFDLAAYSACALLVAERRAAWRLLVGIAIGVAAVVAVLKAWDWYGLRRDGSHLLIFVAAYYGWLALALPMIAATRRELIVGLAVAASVAGASLSMTAVALLAGGNAMTAAATTLQRLTRLLTPCVAALAVAAAAGLSWLLLHSLPLALEKESLRDRVLVHRLVQADLAADPGSLLLGHGWGRTQDAFHVWLNLSGERLWEPTWIFLRSDYFHSHHWALEALHAIGLPGMLLVLAGFVALPLFARRERLAHAAAFAIATILFHGMWFQLCLSIPLTAMALAAMADRTRLLPRVPAGAAAWLGIAIAMAQMAAAAALLSHGLAIGTVREAWTTTPPRPVPIPADFRGSDLAAAELIRDTLTSFAGRARTEPAAPFAAAIRPMLAFIDGRATDTRTILLLTTGLGAMAQIHVTGELAFAAAPEDMTMWRRWLERLLALAPGRSDQAIPYLTACIVQGHMDEMADLSGRLLAAQPDDPVALYYQGLVAVTQPEQERRTAGMAMIRRAIDHGIERFLPIDPKLKTLFRLP